MAHTRQSRPDSGLDFQVNVLKYFGDDASFLGSGIQMQLPSLGCSEVVEPHVSLHLSIWRETVVFVNLINPASPRGTGRYSDRETGTLLLSSFLLSSLELSDTQSL